MRKFFEVNLLSRFAHLTSTFLSSKAQEYRMTSDHGYDYLEDNMKAIFFARGPNIRPRTELPPFQNIELFNLFSGKLFWAGA